MTPKSVLLLGDDQEPITRILKQRCQQAGMDWVMLSEESPEALTQMSFEVVLQIGVPDALPSVLRFLDLDHETLLLVNGLNMTAHQALVYHPTTLAYGPFPLYRDIPVIELASPPTGNVACWEQGQNFFEALNLTCLPVPDAPGLILGRTVALLVNEATSALMEGVATPADIDTAMKLGTNYPQGPLAWADEAGLDVILSVLEHLYQSYREERYRPMRLLQEKVQSGQLGLKTGQGFYTYQPV